MTGRDYHTEQWVCAGVRVLDGKKATRWQTPGDTYTLFTGKSSYVTGATYEVQVSRESAGDPKNPDRMSTYMHGDPQFVKQPDHDDPKVAEWAAATAVAEAKLRRASMERKAKGIDALDEAMAPLLKISQQMTTGADRDIFTATVLRRLQRVW